MLVSAGCGAPAPRACHSACVQVYCNGEEVLTTSGTQAKYTVDIWSGNHPFFKGSSSTVVVDEGRVNRFKRRYAGLDGLSDMSTMKQGAPSSGSAVVASFPCRHPAAARSGRIRLFPLNCVGRDQALTRLPSSYSRSMHLFCLLMHCQAFDSDKSTREAEASITLGPGGDSPLMPLAQAAATRWTLRRSRRTRARRSRARARNRHTQSACTEMSSTLLSCLRPG